MRRSRLKIAFIPTNVSGVVFYRMWQPYLALKGDSFVKPIIWWYNANQFTLHPWENQVFDPNVGPTIQRDVESACQWADVVVWMVLHSPQSLKLFKHLKAKYDKPFITEVDDYLFGVPEKNAAYEYYKPGEDLAVISHEQMKLSDGLIVSTPYLKELYSSLNPNISVVENHVNLELWKRHVPNKKKVIIGWVGGGGHENDLELVKDPLFEILETNKDVSFTCMSGVPNFFKDKRKVLTINGFRSVGRYPKWVAHEKFDIGLAPLVDNNFNRGKSNLRYLEYSAMGIPTVASPVDHFKRTIRQGENGFFANSHEDWKTALQLLINDVKLRRKIGNAAHADVKKNFNTDDLGNKYLGAVKELLNAKPYEGYIGVPDQTEDSGYGNSLTAIH